MLFRQDIGENEKIEQCHPSEFGLSISGLILLRQGLPHDEDSLHVLHEMEDGANCA